ncbi:MAG: efflux transporter outer membrane subunit [Opitutaceae bacterium]
MRRTNTFQGLAAAGLAALAGCAVGPDYHPVAAPAPATWSTPRENGLADRAPETAAWWRSFNDPTLDSLIDRAAQSNPDLQVAEAHLRQARAIRELNSANFRPGLDVSGSYAKEKISRNQPLFGALPLAKNFPFEYSVYQTGFDASWEIDLFGAKRRAFEAANAEWEGAIESRNDTLISLTAEVARTYVELRGSQRRLEIALKTLDLQQQALDLARARFKSGVTSELDVTRAAALLAGVQAGIPGAKTAVSQAMYGLAALLGKEPDALLAELSAPAPVPPAPPEVPVGLPSELLRRRPDVRRAERQLAAETARIGEAKSDWFPKLSLTGAAGMESISFQKWFEPGSLFWSVGPSLQWRALDFGRVKAEVDAQTAVQQAALATYEKTALTALQETENALVAYAQEQNRHKALVEQLAEDRRTLAMAGAQFAEGRVNYLDVLDAQRSLYEAEDQLAVSDQTVSVDLIALYKALGGGWEK